MADIIFRGWHEAQVAGLLTATPDIQLALVMGSFSGASEEDAVNVDDITTLDEFDGIGYQRIDQTAAYAYDATADEMRLTLADDQFNVAAGSVSPGSDDAIGILVILVVDGTPANDYALAYTTSGGFPINGSNTAIDFTAPVNGLIFQRAA